MGVEAQNSWHSDEERPKQKRSVEVRKDLDQRYEKAQAKLAEWTGEYVGKFCKDCDKFDLFGEDEEQKEKEQQAKEKKEAGAFFEGLGTAFGKNGIEYDAKCYAEAYLSVPKHSRVPLEDVKATIGKVFDRVRDADDLVSSKEFMVCAISDFVSGDLVGATNNLEMVHRELDMVEEFRKFRENTGLDDMRNLQVFKLLRAFDGKIEAGEAISMVKKISAFEDFNELKGDMAQLTELLVIYVPLYKSGRNGPETVRRMVRTEADVLHLKKLANEEFLDATSKLQAVEDELRNYMKGFGRGKVVDENILRLQYGILNHKSGVLRAQKSQYEAFVAHEMAMSYLQKTTKLLKPNWKGVDLALGDFMNGDTDNFGKLSQNYKVAPSSHLPMLMTLKLKIGVAGEEEALKNTEYLKFKGGKNISLLHTHNKFLKTGEIGLYFGVKEKGAAVEKKYLLFGLEEKARGQELLLKTYSQNYEEQVKYFNEISKYGSINKVPKNIREDVAGRLSGAYNFIDEYRKLGGKLLGTYISMDHLGVKTEMEWLKEAGIPNARNQMEGILKFLENKGVKVEKDDDVVDNSLNESFVAREMNTYRERRKGIQMALVEKSKRVSQVVRKVMDFAELRAEGMLEYARQKYGVSGEIALYKRELGFVEEFSTFFDSGQKELVKMRGELAGRLGGTDMEKGVIAVSSSPLSGLKDKLVKKEIMNIDELVLGKDAIMGPEMKKKIDVNLKALRESYGDYVTSSFINSMVQVGIMAIAIGGAVIGGGIAGGIAGKLFGNLASRTAARLIAKLGVKWGGRAVAALNGTNALLTQGMVLSGVSTGTTLGTAAGSSMFKALGAMKKTSWEAIWSPKVLWDGWKRNFIASASIIGGAKFFMAAMTKGATSVAFAQRFPSLASASKTMVSAMRPLRTFADPLRWFKGGKNIKNAYAREYVEEGLQEGWQEVWSQAGMGEIMGGFASLRGSKVRFAASGIDMKAAGIDVKFGRLTFKGSVVDIEAKIQKQLGGRKDIDFEVKTYGNDTVIINVLGKKKGKVKGVGDTFVLNNEASILTSRMGLSIDVEENLQRDKFGDLIVKKVEGVFDLVGKLRQSGFAISAMKGGIRAIKGKMSHAIRFPKKVMAGLRDSKRVAVMWDAFKAKYKAEKGYAYVGSLGGGMQAVFEGVGAAVKAGVGDRQFFSGAEVQEMNVEWQQKRVMEAKKISEEAAKAPNKDIYKMLLSKGRLDFSGAVGGDVVKAWKDKVSKAAGIKLWMTPSQKRAKYVEYLHMNFINNPIVLEVVGGRVKPLGDSVARIYGAMQLGVDPKYIRAKFLNAPVEVNNPGDINLAEVLRVADKQVNVDSISANEFMVELKKHFKNLTGEEHETLRELFPDGVLESHFEQRNTGDCYYLASMHAIKTHPLGPYLLAKMVKKVKGGWTVHFPKAEPIFVGKDDITGQWVINKHGVEEFKNPVGGQLGDKVFERAYGRLVKTHEARLIKKGGSKDTMYVMEGGFEVDALSHILGDLAHVEDYGGRDTLENNPEVRRRVEGLFIRYMNNPKKFILGAGTAYGKIGEARNGYADAKRRFYTTHAFTIASVDAIKRKVTIVDPHGTKNKVHEISYEEFFRYFSTVTGAEIDLSKIKGVDYVNQASIPGGFDVRLTPSVSYSYNVKNGKTINLSNESVSVYVHKDGTLRIIPASSKYLDGPVLKPGEEIILGRDHFIVAENAMEVSGTHVKVKYLGNGKIEVTDLNSSNGTKVADGIRDNGLLNHFESEKALEMQARTFEGKLARGEEKKLYTGTLLNFYLGGREMRVYDGGNGALILNCEGEIHRLDPYRSVKIGRDNFAGTEDANISVSREHLEVQNLGGGYIKVRNLTQSSVTEVKR